MALTSSSVGFCPSERIAVPSSSALISPLPSMSKTSKACAASRVGSQALARLSSQRWGEREMEVSERRWVPTYLLVLLELFFAGRE